VAHPADQEDPDDTFGFRRKMRLSIRRHPEARVVSAHYSVTGQHRPEREAGEAHADVGEERPAAAPSNGAGELRSGGVKIHIHEKLTTD
jgi:hypothetical protein